MAVSLIDKADEVAVVIRILEMVTEVSTPVTVRGQTSRSHCQQER